MTAENAAVLPAATASVVMRLQGAAGLARQNVMLASAITLTCAAVAQSLGARLAVVCRPLMQLRCGATLSYIGQSPTLQAMPAPDQQSRRRCVLARPAGRVARDRGDCRPTC